MEVSHFLCEALGPKLSNFCALFRKISAHLVLTKNKHLVSNESMDGLETTCTNLLLCTELQTRSS